MSDEITFKPAKKEAAKARIGLIGPAGSGKTYTALRIASAMGQRIAVIDTEYGSASKYADEFQFDSASLTNFDPRTYIKAIRAAINGRYDVLVIDSASHEWYACLEMVDRLTPRFGNNSWAAWSEVTPIHRQFVDTILSAPLHVIATFRAKTEYAEVTTPDGKTKMRKVGIGAATREGMEHELDIVGDLDLAHTLTITKTRCRELDNQQIPFPGEELAQIILQWLAGNSAPQTQPLASPVAQDAAPKPADGPMTPDQKRQLWAFAQQQQLDLEQLLKLINGVLGTDYPTLGDVPRSAADKLLQDVSAMTASATDIAAAKAPSA